MEHNVIQSLDYGERVTSTYAEIYYNDEYCGFKSRSPEDVQHVATVSKKEDTTQITKSEWVSPSDTLIGKNDLTPPFTSKITRGITHKGILKIGGEVLERERATFAKYLAKLLDDNDSAWKHIEEQERVVITKKVEDIYNEIFKTKCAVMLKETAKFYEETLQELEEHIRCEVRTVLMSAHCSMINDLNQQIKEKLAKEKSKLERVLKKRYANELIKVRKYYNLLLHNEKFRSNKLVNQVVRERNEALQIFCKQIQAENTTSTMYVMCTERKKCRMRRFLLETFNTKEIEEKLKTIKEKQEILDDFQKNKKQIFDLNKEWEEKVKKILQLFLKFISFSLRLLPEQIMFLLDLEKLVVLQLNEIQKHPTVAHSILKTVENLTNMFEFYKPEKEESVCEGEPFVIEGKMTPSESTSYSSQETIPLHKELPFFRVQRQFIYAKCQKLNQVRDFLEAERCKCRDPPKEPSIVESSSITPPVPSPSPQVTPESSNELLMVDDILRLQKCPYRGCQDYLNKLAFPNLDDYFDFTEEKFARVEAILGTPAKLEPTPKLMDPKDITFRELPFAATKELCKNVATQYLSDEDLPKDLSCSCMDGEPRKRKKEKAVEVLEEKQRRKNIIETLAKSTDSIKRILHENPKLLQLFSEESFDFIL